MVGRFVHCYQHGMAQNALGKHELAQLAGAELVTIQDTVGVGVELRDDGKDATALAR